MPLSLRMALGVLHNSTEDPTRDTKGKTKALGVQSTGTTKKKITSKATGGKKEVAGRGKKESAGPSSDQKGKSKAVGVPPVTPKLEKGVATARVATATLPQRSSARLNHVAAAFEMAEWEANFFKKTPLSTKRLPENLNYVVYFYAHIHPTDDRNSSVLSSYVEGFNFKITNALIKRLFDLPVEKTKCYGGQEIMKYEFCEEEEDTPVQEGEETTDDEEDFDEEDSDYDSDDEADNKGTTWQVPRDPYDSQDDMEPQPVRGTAYGGQLQTTAWDDIIEPVLDDGPQLTNLPTETATAKPDLPTMESPPAYEILMSLLERSKHLRKT
ncbi:hypothetical protein Scep_005039 [Stephania cephalantha]|uniref:Uncharacterized protein n=1 Tax=Stephania cephalantha TaxID=152367 RepID=A0AAP0KUG8_9MAGN